MIGFQIAGSGRDLPVEGELDTRDPVAEGIDLLHLGHGGLVPNGDGRHLRTGSLGYDNVVAAVPFRQLNGQGSVMVRRVEVDLDVADDAHVSLGHAGLRQRIIAVAEIDDGHETVLVGGIRAASGAVAVSVAVLQFERRAFQRLRHVPLGFDDLHAGTRVRAGGFPDVQAAARGLALIVGGDIRIGLLRRLPRLQAANRHGFIRLDGGDGRVGDRPVVAHARSGQHDLANDIIREHAAILKMLKEVADRSRAVG